MDGATIPSFDSLAAKDRPKASLMQLWQAIWEVWNQSAKRHGLLKVWGGG